MKFTVAFITLLSLSAPWSILAKRADDVKDKREAPASYVHGLSSSSYASSGQSPSSYTSSGQSPSSYTSSGQSPSNYASSGHSSASYQPSYQISTQNYQPATNSHGDASSINVGAGYSIGGIKPSFSYDGQGSAGLQYASQEYPANGHATIQLAPITLQPTHGAGGLVSGDISQIMNQLSHSLNSGALSLQPSNSVAEFHIGGEGGQGQELSQPQYTYGKLQQYNLVGSLGGSPAHYASGVKGLSSYGSTGPVLFHPSESQSSQSSALTYSAPSSGHSADEGSSASSSSGGHSLAGLSFGSSGHPFGASLKSYGGNNLGASKTPFTPSVFLGSSVQGDSSHGLSAGPVAYSTPSFAGFPGGNAAFTFGPAANGPSYPGSFGGFGADSSKFLAPAFGSIKSEGLGHSLDGLASFGSAGQFASPPGTTYGFPTASYPAVASHSASAARPYYVSTPTKHSHKGSGSSLSSPHSGSKHSYAGHSGSRYSPKDTHGAHSETSYNTIKYSEELKPRVH
ncbi:nuclear pore complex protein Nup214 [Bombyx mori]|uniref:Cuticle protein n=1 Tax=Bombyx mori TaxID=7091 RepID=A0A8R2C6Q2_BOMMO|nr:nuclear pore complex protein Nup214 [Bombyx mori]